MIKKGRVNIGDENVRYFSFGKGKKNLVILQGLTIRDLAGSEYSLSKKFKQLSKNYTVYFFDRRMNVTEKTTTWDLAEDVNCAMNTLGIESADFLGVSHGGMIALALAIRHPEKVSKLCIAVSECCPNKTSTKVLNNWIDLAKKRDYKTLCEDSIRKVYTRSFVRKIENFFPIIRHFGKPKDFDRFANLARCARDFDCTDEIGKITCPSFVIAGNFDEIVTVEGTIKIAHKLNCVCYIYTNGAHSVYEEEKDFADKVFKFLVEGAYNFRK